MIDLDEFNKKIIEYDSKINELAASLKISELEEELKLKEAQMNEPDFWNDQENSAAVSAAATAIKKQLEKYNSIKSKKNDLEVLIEFYKEACNNVQTSNNQGTKNSQETKNNQGTKSNRETKSFQEETDEQKEITTQMTAAEQESLEEEKEITTQMTAAEQEILEEEKEKTTQMTAAEQEILEEEKEIKNLAKDLASSIAALEVSTLLSEKYDQNAAIVTIHPGAGGTEAQDWAQMLYRMYTRWAQAHDFKCEELDYLVGEEAGLKSVSFEITGNFAYGYLKSENGVHRLVRISPFDAGGRRHTSFASVEVLPEIDTDIDIEIAPEDIKMDVYRASGAGGQHINKTSSAVRLTHIPTGIVVACQTQRSQFQNRDYAMKMLKSKLIAIKEKENLETINDLKGVQKDIAWGSQIRSYVFCPYTLVKDHRTNYEVGNVEAVMDGDLDEFIFAYLKYLKK